MPGAGDLRDRVAFQRRTELSDGAGNFVSDWEPMFERSAMFVMRPGNESVLAARLEGRQPITVVVRFDSQTKTVTPDWRLLDLRNGNRVLAITAADDLDRRRQWWTMVCEVGRVA